jgi:hypothetical protein
VRCQHDKYKLRNYERNISGICIPLHVVVQLVCAARITIPGMLPTQTGVQCTPMCVQTVQQHAANIGVQCADMQSMHSTLCEVCPSPICLMCGVLWSLSKR